MNHYLNLLRQVILASVSIADVSHGLLQLLRDDLARGRYSENESRQWL